MSHFPPFGTIFRASGIAGVYDNPVWCVAVKYNNAPSYYVILEPWVPATRDDNEIKLVDGSNWYVKPPQREDWSRVPPDHIVATYVALALSGDICHNNLTKE